MKVSFCVTCYDKDSYLLQQSIDTLQKQTVEPDEILVIASGLKSLVCTNPKVKIYNFEKRMSAGEARNKGGELATGDIVCFCDVDDFVHTQKCEVIKRVFENQNIDALVHNYNLNVSEFKKIDVESVHVEKITDIDNPPSTNVATLSRMPVCHGHVSVRRSVAEKLKYEDSSYSEDGVFCQSIVKSQNFNLYYTPLILINYITQ